MKAALNTGLNLRVSSISITQSFHDDKIFHIGLLEQRIHLPVSVLHAVSVTYRLQRYLIEILYLLVTAHHS